GCRLYFRDGAGHFFRYEAVVVAGDDAAQAKARELGHSYCIEVGPGSIGSGGSNPEAEGTRGEGPRYSKMDHSCLHDEPSKVDAEEGEVIVDGPDGVAVSLTPEAAIETSHRL